MSCTSPKAVFRMTLLIITFIVSCLFLASVVWLLTTRSLSRYENYYLSRINITNKFVSENESSVSDHYKDLIKIEIAMRRVEENSRRLKEYTKSLLWNKDKSLWCVLFKDSDRSGDRSVVRMEKHRRVLDESYIRTLRDQKMREAVIHLRHHGHAHHRRRIDGIPDYIK